MGIEGGRERRREREGEKKRGGGGREGANILVKNAHSTHLRELEKNRLRGMESERERKGENY